MSDGVLAGETHVSDPKIVSAKYIYVRDLYAN